MKFTQKNGLYISERRSKKQPKKAAVFIPKPENFGALFLFDTNYFMLIDITMTFWNIIEFSCNVNRLF